MGVYIPDDEEQTNSIVLLTTVQQYVNEGGFCINEGKSGTLAGYNTSFVKLQNQSEKIELKDYALKKNCYHITPLPTENVIFFMSMMIAYLFKLERLNLQNLIS